MSEQTLDVPHVPYSMDALEVLNRARAYAEQFGDEQIEPGHLMLAVFSHNSLVAKRLMDTLQLRLDRALQRFSERWGNSKNPSLVIGLQYNDATWEVLQVALSEANKRGRDEVKPIDLLFALAELSKYFPSDMEVVIDLLTHAHKDGEELTSSRVVEFTLHIVERYYQPAYS